MKQTQFAIKAINVILKLPHLENPWQSMMIQNDK